MNAKTSGAKAEPDDDATEAEDSGPATATKTGDNTEVALGPSDSKEDITHAASPGELHPSEAASHVDGAPTQGRVSEGITSANPHDAAARETAPAIFDGTQTAEQEATATEARTTISDNGHGPTSGGLRLGGGSGSSSCDSENMGEEGPITTGVPSKSIQWQRPVPSGLSATGTMPRIAAWPEPLVMGPRSALPTVEKHSCSPSLHGVDALGLRVNEPLSEADAHRQHPLPTHQQDTTASTGIDEQPFLHPGCQTMNEPLPEVGATQQHSQSFDQQDTAASACGATEQPFLQQGSQPMNIGADAKPGETLEPFGHNMVQVQTAIDNTRPIPKKSAQAANLDRSQVPRNLFSSIERFMDDDVPVTSNQGLWLRGVQCGIGHGLTTMKNVILGEIEHKGLMFGRPYPLDPGLTRAEQRRVIESNTGFDRLVAQRAGDTFMAAHFQAMRARRRHGSSVHSSATPFPQAPMAHGPPAGHMNPGPTPTSPFLPRFATNPMSAGGLAAQGLRYSQGNSGFSRPSVGPWMNPSPEIVAVQNYNIGDKTQPDDAAFPEFAAVPDGLPRQSTDWRGGEFPCTSPQLTTTKDGRAVISMSRREGGDGET